MQNIHFVLLVLFIIIIIIISVPAEMKQDFQIHRTNERNKWCDTLTNRICLHQLYSSSRAMLFFFSFLKNN